MDERGAKGGRKGRGREGKNRTRPINQSATDLKSTLTAAGATDWGCAECIKIHEEKNRRATRRCRLTPSQSLPLPACLRGWCLVGVLRRFCAVKENRKTEDKARHTHHLESINNDLFTVVCHHRPPSLHYTSPQPPTHPSIHHTKQQQQHQQQQQPNRHCYNSKIFPQMSSHSRKENASIVES